MKIVVHSQSKLKTIIPNKDALKYQISNHSSLLKHNAHQIVS
jgi:hypothetical protein